MAAPIYIGGKYAILTEANNGGAVGAGPIDLVGFYVNSTNSGTVAFTDGSLTVTGTITPAIGYHELPIQFGTQCNATTGGTAINITFFFSKSKTSAL